MTDAVAHEDVLVAAMEFLREDDGGCTTELEGVEDELHSRWIRAQAVKDRSASEAEDVYKATLRRADAALHAARAQVVLDRRRAVKTDISLLLIVHWMQQVCLQEQRITARISRTSTRSVARSWCERLS